MTREELRDYVEEQRSLNNIPYHVYSALIDGIDTLEQEPKKGHWTDDGYCSCCNKQTLPLDISGYASGYDSFCPNCGAKMESEE